MSRALRGTPGRAARRLATAGLAAALGVGLAGCSPSAPDPSTSATEATAGFAFTSPDGTVRAWDVAERGEPLELSGTAFDGETVDVAAHRGELVLLNTWYAFCPPCRAEAGDLVALDADYPELHLFGINGTDDAGTAQAFERQFEVTYPSIDDADGAALAALQGTVPVSATPTTIVLDREGRVAVRVIGILDPGVVRPLLDALLAEAP